MKSLARLHVWWPGIDAEIETLVRHCAACQSIRNSQPPTTLHPWAWPNRPWQRVHLDFAGPGHMFLLMVDAHSKWLEVIMMTSTTAEKTITELRKVFASYGLPEQLISDNGPQFTSSEFDVFMKCNGIKHILTAPYHPKSNGEAERAVQTFKNGLLAQKMEKDDVQTKLSRFLMSYRNTPHSTTGVTPVELFLKQRVRTRLDLLRPNVAERVSQHQATAKQNSDKKARLRDFEVGEAVFVENLIKQGQPKWLPGTIVEKVGSVMYRVQVNDKTWRRHADQLRPKSNSDMTTEVEAPMESDSTIEMPGPIIETEVPGSHQPPTPISTANNERDNSELVTVTSRYPQRNHRPPDRYIEHC